MKSLIACLSLSVFSLASYAQYWAEYDYSSLRTASTLTVNNLSDEDLRCKLSALNQNIFIEIRSGGKSKPIEVIKGLRIHNLSLYCKPIEKITKKQPWRLNNHINGYELRNFVFFPLNN